MTDVSAVGLSLRISASVTFPNGFTVTSFADDGDNGVSENSEIIGDAIGLNAELITWDTPKSIPYNVNVIPNTEDETNLQTLLNANRTTKNKRSVKDVVTIVETNPITGATRTFKQGKIKGGPVGYQYGGDGRIKNRQYTFIFEDVV